VSRRRVLEAKFVLLEFSSPSRRIFIGSHSLPPSLVRRIGPSRSTWPRTLVRSSSRAGGDFSVAGFYRIRDVCLVIGEYDEALPCGIVAPGAGAVGVTKPVVRGVEEPPEHH
jgi:hypothetical protein